MKIRDRIFWTVGGIFGAAFLATLLHDIPNALQENYNEYNEALEAAKGDKAVQEVKDSFWSRMTDLDKNDSMYYSNRSDLGMWVLTIVGGGAAGNFVKFR